MRKLIELALPLPSRASAASSRVIAAGVPSRSRVSVASRTDSAMNSAFSQSLFTFDAARIASRPAIA